jgi:hypothetical protein
MTVIKGYPSVQAQTVLRSPMLCMCSTRTKQPENLKELPGIPALWSSSSDPVLSTKELELYTIIL